MGLFVHKFVAQIAQCYPGLVSLDLSLNKLCARESLVQHLPRLKELKLLTLLGNPVTLLLYYRDQCLFCNKGLTTLDDIPLPVQL